MKSLKYRIRRRAYQCYLAARYPRFYRLQKKTHGLLSPEVYHKMYTLCRDLPDLDIVEIGGAAGGGSIAVAWAMRDSQKTSKLVVVERCEGGSRMKFGDYSDNLNLIQQHFTNFGVQDRISLYPHEITLENGHEVTDLIETEEISAFIHDADGHLERDFALFWPLLRPNGLIIIDDCVDTMKKYHPISTKYREGGIKKPLTYRLLNKLIEWGLFTPFFQTGSTMFGYKPPDADFRRFDLDACNQILEEVERERLDYLASFNAHDQ